MKKKYLFNAIRFAVECCATLFCIIAIVAALNARDVVVVRAVIFGVLISVIIGIEKRQWKREQNKKESEVVMFGVRRRMNSIEAMLGCLIVEVKGISGRVTNMFRCIKESNEAIAALRAEVADLRRYTGCSHGVVVDHANLDLTEKCALLGQSLVMLAVDHDDLCEHLGVEFVTTPETSGYRKVPVPEKETGADYPPEM